MFSVCRESRGYYFVGIGGVSMSALALFLSEHGARVAGSDAAESERTRLLRERGIPVSIGEWEEIGEETVVYTGAVGPEHPQLAKAKRAGKRLVSRAELLGRIAEEFPHVLSVAGCHGKTTTTCMLSHVLNEAGAPYTCHIGGEDLDFGNYRSAGDAYFITEACEFQRSFLALRSEIAVILNCDLDHTDCYRDEEDIFAAYRAFASQAKEVAVNADDLRARNIPHAIDFGLYAGRVRAERLRSAGERYAFDIVEDETPVVRVKLNVVGKVHVYNALAAYCVSRLAGFSGEEVRKGLEGFRGVKRRFERVGAFGQTPVICDYAHHPREIAASIAAAERLCTGNVRVLFQPHTYTRTRDLLGDFVSVLEKTERPILYRTYSAREKFDYAGSAAMLAAKIPSARYAQTPEQLGRLLETELEPDDLLLVLGAGDIYDVVKKMI